MITRSARRAALKPLLSLICLFLAGFAALAQVPPHLDIVSATIEENPPIVRQNVPGRGVTLRLSVAGPISCTPASGFLVYGFLIDTDSDPATGLSLPAFDVLGVEARVTATCDPPTGTFVCPLGPVTVTPGPGFTTLEIRTTVAAMPALSCRWIAFAQQGAVFSRLPQAPEFSHWGTHEKEVF